LKGQRRVGEGSVAKFDGRFAYCPDRGIAFEKSCRRGTLHAPCNNALVWPKLWIVLHSRGQNLGLRRTKFFNKKLCDRTTAARNALYGTRPSSLRGGNENVTEQLFVATGSVVKHLPDFPHYVRWLINPSTYPQSGDGVAHVLQHPTRPEVQVPAVWLQKELLWLRYREVQGG
jgi:hypothetical protein